MPKDDIPPRVECVAVSFIAAFTHFIFEIALTARTHTHRVIHTLAL